MNRSDGGRDLFPARLRVFRIVAAVVFTLLVARLWQLQFVRGPELKARAENNRFARREIEADRGVIYDLNGELVVHNRPQFAVRIVPAALPEDPAERRRVLDRVASVLESPSLEEGSSPARGRAGDGAGLVDGNRAADGLSADAERRSGAEPGSVAGALPEDPGAGRQSIESLLPRDDRGRLLPTWSAATVARNVPRDVAFALMEDEVELPGVIIGESSVREYPAGPTLAHILGFTGSITQNSLEEYLARGYQRYDVVGRTGIEYTYEEDLRGTKGEKVVMVDAMGQELERVADPLAPEAGQSLVLTLDLEFQRATESALQRGLDRIGARSGAAVVLDPKDGAVRALVSLPTYDNNMFSTGASPEDWQDLLANEDNPLLNRAISGQYPPGSVYKMITAAAGLQEGDIDRSTRITCPVGGIIHIRHQYLPGISYPYYCWNAGGHGSVNVVSALAQSCDVFFYEVAGGHAHGRPTIEGLGSERLGDYARMFGLGDVSGIRLLGEAPGLVPNAEWLRDTFDRIWVTGETYIMGIGQGYSLTTPLQMARATMAVANGGRLHPPKLVDHVEDVAGNRVPSRVGALPEAPELAVDPEHLATVRQGMLTTVQAGTARSAWTQLPSEVSVAGKTGTAEFCDAYEVEPGVWDCRRDREGNLLTHAWFVAFAPYEDPEIAVAVFVDGSKLDRIIEGSREAAPIAAEIIRAYFDIPNPFLAPATDTPGDTPAPDSSGDEGEPDTTDAVDASGRTEQRETEREP